MFIYNTMSEKKQQFDSEKTVMGWLAAHFGVGLSRLIAHLQN